LGRCFVIQPFDKGAYDKRYEDVIVPAIIKAGLEDYRIDRDPGTEILIEAIEEGIEKAMLVLRKLPRTIPTSGSSWASPWQMANH